MPEDFEKMGEKFTKALEDLGADIKNTNKKIEDVQKQNIILDNKVDKFNTVKIDEGEKNELDALAGPEEISKSVEEKVVARIEAKLKNEKDYDSQCKSWDSAAFKKFPDLYNKTSQFSKAVEDEIKNIFPIGYDAKGQKILPPDAVFNAASRVAADLAVKGEFKTPVYEELESGGNFQRKIKGQEITEIQKDLATFYKPYGINEKRLEERIRSRNER